MNEKETLANLEELGKSEYRMLKETYCKLQELRTTVDAMHDTYVADGTPPSFNQIEALHLQMDDLFEDLERFLLPVCSTSSCGPAMCVKES